MTNLAADFFRQNEWANQTIIDACRGLTDEQLDTDAVGTYGTIRNTFRHIVSSEAGYATRLGHEPSPRFTDGVPWPGFDAISEMAAAAGESLIAAVDDPAERILEVGGQRDRYTVEATVILAQAFNHSTEHRSQISTILTTLGIEPPDLSGWDWGLAVGRMHKL